jgi:putative FmdB family regulatory protein
MDLLPPCSLKPPSERGYDGAEPGERGGQGMPTYEYRCANCRKTFTKEASIAEHEAKPPTCPKCGSQQVVRSFSTVYVQTSKKS